MVTPGAAQSQNTVSAGLQIGLGTKAAATEVINTQGGLNETDNQYDVAIQGGGFFEVQRPDGDHCVHPGGPVPPQQPGHRRDRRRRPFAAQHYRSTERDFDHHHAVRSGERHAAGAAEPVAARADSAGDLSQPGGLQNVGSNLLQATLSSGDPVLGNPGGAEGLGTLQQNWLENSNGMW